LSNELRPVGRRRTPELLCDELGIGCLLVRGNFGGTEAGDGGGHAWNVISLYNGERRVVDVMHAPG
jgi:transglutaminase/protease-like cytokinesis protein 3